MLLRLLLALSSAAGGYSERPAPGWIVQAAVDVLVAEYSITAPAQLREGNAALRIRNTGLAAHALRLVRLDSTRTLRDLERAFLDSHDMPVWAVDVAGAMSVDPGSSKTVRVALTPGLHVLLCVAPISGGAPMLMKGMYRAFNVLPTQTRKS